MFAFLIDPNGWIDIYGEQFAPGFFVWNSEVGKRCVGIQTFWYQRICSNHIVWDAVEVIEFTRKHTANVGTALDFIRTAIGNLVAKRDVRRDRFAEVIDKAIHTKIADDGEAAITKLTQHGIGSKLAKEAVGLALAQGSLTIFAVVDALTRVSGKSTWIGDRTEADSKAASLLSLAM